MDEENNDSGFLTYILAAGLAGALVALILYTFADILINGV